MARQYQAGNPLYWAYGDEH